jgi:multidrug resistance efflux pump
MKRRLPFVIAGVVALAAGLYYAAATRVQDIVLTGIVTTDDVIVGSEVQGRLQKLLVQQGDHVQRGQLLGVIQPEEWKADMAFYADSEQQSAARVAQAEADLRYQETQTREGTGQAEAHLAAAQADLVQGQADLENARLNFEREQSLYKRGVESAQAYDQARTV